MTSGVWNYSERVDLAGFAGRGGDGWDALEGFLESLVERLEAPAPLTHQQILIIFSGLMLADDRGVYWRLSGRRNLEFFAVLAGLPRREARTRAGEVMRAARILKYFAGEALRRHGRTLDSTRPGLDVSTYRELGMDSSAHSCVASCNASRLERSSTVAPRNSNPSRQRCRTSELFSPTPPVKAIASTPPMIAA